MSKNQLFGIFAIAFGAWLVVHCPRAAIGEFRTGVAKGLNLVTYQPRNFARAGEPVGFWLTIVGTMLAGVMGLFFLLFGIGLIVWA